ncbi:MAG TPA: thioredoxin domain-containing protein [Puia sp.]|nr:thioredoxin domain-containing protein [Puia sp.]
MQHGSQKTNRLALETSPYLLQHSHNPVDWYPWGKEALETARSQDKPILVSIGYSACHWCHVMEKESFEHEETARFMNEHFVNIKVDREERPDIDHIYMDAVQAITGGGGWPLNVFLTPEAKPFYGGTYFPPRPIYNRSSWLEVLAGVVGAFRDRRSEVEQHADALTRHVATAGMFGIGDAKTAAGHVFQQSTLQEIKRQLLSSADTTWGGFGQAPKFPQTFSIRYLLYDYSVTGDRAALDQACLSLDAMISGGIYDQLGGGFARYSTDDRWLVPHFEKMLYDNALLIITLCEAFQLIHPHPAVAADGPPGGPLRAQRYREVIEQTIAFADRELSNGQGGFFAALDADSEGEEGRYYVWHLSEIVAILGVEDAQLFNSHYGVTASGNWEGKNILTCKAEAPAGPGQRDRLEASRARLLEYRRKRVPPGLDDKILLGWNALMNIALSKAYAALGEDRYREKATANMRFLSDRLRTAGGQWLHAWKDGGAIPAFLDDHASVIAALIQLQEITGNAGYLREAETMLRYVIDHFGDPETGFFFYTDDGQRDVLLRKKEIYDGATPSGNSMMASNLLYLSIIFDRPEWAQRASQMASALGRVVTAYPGSFGGWATLFQAFTYSISEVVITGRKPENARKEFLARLVPFRVFQSSQEENTQFPLLRDKPVETGTLIFLCKNYSCQLPVNEVDTAIRLIENVHKFQK